MRRSRRAPRYLATALVVIAAAALVGKDAASAALAIANARRVADYLETDPDVDAKRLAVEATLPCEWCGGERMPHVEEAIP